MSATLLPGVDKLHLFTQDFGILDSRVFGVGRSTMPGKEIEDLPIIMRDESGRIEHGNYAMFKGQKIPYVVSVNKVGMIIQCNPSKIAHPYKLMDDVNQVKDVIKSIGEDMKESGIVTNITNSIISRVDLAKQDFMGRDLSNYRMAYEFLQGKRMKSKGYESGYLFHNGQQEACFYDKGIESGISSINGLLRSEGRFKNSRSVCKNLGVKTFLDFCKTDCNQWNENYNLYFNDSIFRKAGEGTFIDFNSEVERLKALKASGRNAILEYMVSVGMDTILLKFGSIDCLFDLMKAAGFSKETIKKERGKMRERITKISKSKVVSVSLLISELKKKFAA